MIFEQLFGATKAREFFDVKFNIANQKVEEVKKLRQEADEVRQKELDRLEKIAGLSKEQAKSILLQLTEEENRDVIAERIAKIEKEGIEELETKYEV